MTICSPSQATIKEAASILQEGGVVSFPTETVYGLGCDTFNEEAIATVYALKNRPTNNPMIAHILDTTWVSQLTDHWSKQCNMLAEQFWPGPLTIVLPKKPSVPKSACGGFETIAIRCPSHPVARMLLAAFDTPISAPSANISGHVSPTTAQHVEDEFLGKVMVIDGGPSEKGIESTVVSMVHTPTILRPGSISIEDIAVYIGVTETTESSNQTNSPGTTTKHYAPKTNVCACTSRSIEDISDNNCVVLSITTKPIITKQIIAMPITSKKYASVLYAALRKADTLGASTIYIELPPTTSEWRAVLDRITRCCA